MRWMIIRGCECLYDTFKFKGHVFTSTLRVKNDDIKRMTTLQENKKKQRGERNLLKNGVQSGGHVIWDTE